MQNTPATMFVPDPAWLSIVQSLRLSAREAQIARLLLNDATEGAIAETLSISPHTVHTHLERLYRKLNVRSRCQVVIRIFQRYVEISKPQGV
jgi:DNA-binding CsgD family transcriptional regulator